MFQNKTYIPAEEIYCKLLFFHPYEIKVEYNKKNHLILIKTIYILRFKLLVPTILPQFCKQIRYYLSGQLLFWLNQEKMPVL